MSNAIARMPKSKGDKPKREDRAVKIAGELVQKASIVAKIRGVYLAELLSEWLRPVVEREYAKEVKRLTEEQK